MSNFSDFRHTRLWRHPSTWLLIAATGLFGGWNMLNIREARRAAGDPIQLGALWLERAGDILFGAVFQITLVLIAISLLAGLMEYANIWLRQTTLAVLYLAIFGLTFVF